MKLLKQLLIDNSKIFAIYLATLIALTVLSLHWGAFVVFYEKKLGIATSDKLIQVLFCAAVVVNLIFMRKYVFSLSKYKIASLPFFLIVVVISSILWVCISFAINMAVFMAAGGVFR
jgi:hypothetical protein